MVNLGSFYTIALLVLITGAGLGAVANSSTGQVQTPSNGIILVNTCQAENHAGATNINCVISTTAGNWIVATGTAAGTNAACTQNPILGINSFSFDAGGLYTNWHGSNKLSVETYDSGQLVTSGSLTVTLSGQCFMNFSTLTVYQFSGVTGASLPASVNVCNNQQTGVTTLSCTLTSFAGNGKIVGHASADCTACSFNNQVSTITQASDGNFTDYGGVIATVTPSASNTFSITNGASFNGAVSAIEITGPVRGNSNVTSSPGIPATVPTLPLIFIGGSIGLIIGEAKKGSKTLYDQACQERSEW